MNKIKDKKLKIWIYMVCIVSLVLTVYAFVFLPKTNVALSSFF